MRKVYAFLSKKALVWFVSKRKREERASLVMYLRENEEKERDDGLFQRQMREDVDKTTTK